ncbi:hypothetical protein EXN66_Car015046 [Channa argus]|uniref:Uncharacterized protein n=1 Tax=Channa argus TaxID=215402 RepID=A0A6G1QAB9_CHAAH|nr:hypothetical protein EXN66_Car015046 [Channa argus]
MFKCGGQGACYENCINYQCGYRRLQESGRDPENWLVWEKEHECDVRRVKKCEVSRTAPSGGDDCDVMAGEVIREVKGGYE